MTDSVPNPETPDVPSQVFDKFLQAIRDANLPDELVARLQKVLSVDGSLTENALKAAVLGEDPLP